MPAIPRPLPVTAAIVPAIIVPCQLLGLSAQPENSAVSLSRTLIQSPGSLASLSHCASRSLAMLASLMKS